MVGVYVLYKGIEALLRLVYQPPAEAPAAEEEPPAPRRRRSRLAAVVGIAALLVAGTATAFVAGGGVEAPAQPITRCNGHAALCDRPLDEVVLAATHNSMSVPLPGWVSAEQERPIGGQLEDGIHGLLLDTHYGDRLAERPHPHVLRERRGPAARERAGRRVAGQRPGRPAPARAARVPRRGHARHVPLPHLLRARRHAARDGLKDIHDFLATHPREVVVMVNQDYVKPADFVEAIDDADLTPYAFTPPRGSEWPTLREMIEDGRRLVMLAENRAGRRALVPARLRAPDRGDAVRLRLRGGADRPGRARGGLPPNRGPAGAPLFLINHWVTTARSSARATPRRSTPTTRCCAASATCERVRDHLPNLLAINFYKEGDVFRVVDTLNRVGGRRRSSAARRGVAL